MMRLVIQMQRKSPCAMPLSMMRAMNRGWTSSMATSTIMKTGARRTIHL